MAKHHPNKEISKAIEYALENGWRFEKSRGHIFGQLFCPGGKRGDCIVRVYSTPRNTDIHARRIRQSVDSCDHQGTDK